MAQKILKIMKSGDTGHEVGPADWKAATESVDTGHKNDPDGALVLKIGKEQRTVAVRADAAGNIYLEFRD